MAQMTRTLLLVAALLALASVASAQDSDFTWPLEDFIRGTVSTLFGDGAGGEEPQEKPDGEVCTQEEVCDKDGKKYPNKCVAKKAGVKVAPCPPEARSGLLLGIPKSVLDVGIEFFSAATAPLKNLVAGEDKEDAANNESSNDPLDQLFADLGRRRLLQKAF